MSNEQEDATLMRDGETRTYYVEVKGIIEVERAAVPWDEWPVGRELEVELELEHGVVRFMLASTALPIFEDVTPKEGET